MSARPTSIIHLASGDLWAGAEVQLYQLVTSLARRDDIVVAVVLLNDGMLASRLREAGIDVTVFPESEWSSLKILRALITFLRRRRPDVLHTHRQKENVLGSIAARIAGVRRSLRTVHGAPEFAAGGPTRRINQWLDRASARFFQDAVVLVTDDLRERLAGEYSDRKCFVIENGISPVEHRANSGEAPCWRRADRINVCFAGRLTSVKRPDLFVAIAAALKGRGDERFHFHVFGDGPLAENASRQVVRDDVGDCVSLWGFCDDMPAALAEMDVLVMTSDHEGLPMIMLEAMALGVPIVAHAVGGMPGVLADGDCGVLVKRQDAAAFADALAASVDAGTLGALAEKARRRFDANYTVERCAARYVALYTAGLEPA